MTIDHSMYFHPFCTNTVPPTAMGRVGGTPLKSRGSVGSMGGTGGVRTVTGSVAGKAKCPATLLWGATGEQEWTAALTTGKEELLVLLVANIIFLPPCTESLGHVLKRYW